MQTGSDCFSLCVSLVLCLSIAIVAILFVLIKSRRKITKLPPGPSGLDALRCTFSALKDGSLHKVADEWSRRYGELVLCRSLLGDICFLNSARLVRELYSSKEHEALTNYRPKTFIGWFAAFGYRNVVTGSPHLRPEWNKSRKMFHHTIKFYGDGVGQLESTVQSELQRLVAELESKKGQDVEVDSTFSNSLLCVIAVLISGEIPPSSKGVLKLMKHFDDTANNLMNPISESTLAAFSWLRFLPLLPFRKLCNDLITARDKVLQLLVTDAKSSHVQGRPRGMVDVLFDEQGKEDNHWLSDDHVKGIVLDTIGAAYLTSLQTLKAVFLYLTHSPEVMHRIQLEIEDKIGTRPPRVEDRSKFPYTEAVILETLRLSSIVPLGLPHETAEEVTIDGYTIPKKCTLMANTILFHFDPEVFPDPDKFQPERFLDDDGNLLPATHPRRQSLIPFGIGKRSCPGESFARSRIFLYITTLLQKFDVLPPVKHELLPAKQKSWNNGLVLHLQPYHVVFHQRA